MEQTTPQPTRPVMDVARPRPAAPVAVRAAAPAPVKSNEQPPVPAANHTGASSEPPKPADHKPEEAPKPAQTPHAPQALAVRKAPVDDSEKSAEPAPAESVAQDDAAAAEEQAHQESTVSTGPHAPVGVIVVTVLAMILLCALATMIYFDTQK